MFASKILEYMQEKRRASSRYVDSQSVIDAINAGIAYEKYVGNDYNSMIKIIDNMPSDNIISNIVNTEYINVPNVSVSGNIIQFSTGGHRDLGEICSLIPMHCPLDIHVGMMLLSLTKIMMSDEDSIYRKVSPSADIAITSISLLNPELVHNCIDIVRSNLTNSNSIYMSGGKHGFGNGILCTVNETLSMIDSGNFRVSVECRSWLRKLGATANIIIVNNPKGIRKLIEAAVELSLRTAVSENRHLYHVYNDIIERGTSIIKPNVSYLACKEGSIRIMDDKLRTIVDAMSNIIVIDKCADKAYDISSILGKGLKVEELSVRKIADKCYYCFPEIGNCADTNSVDEGSDCGNSENVETSVTNSTENIGEHDVIENVNDNSQQQTNDPSVGDIQIINGVRMYFTRLGMWARHDDQSNIPENNVADNDDANARNDVNNDTIPPDADEQAEDEYYEYDEYDEYEDEDDDDEYEDDDDEYEDDDDEYEDDDDEYEDRDEDEDSDDAVSDVPVINNNGDDSTDETNVTNINAGLSQAYIGEDGRFHIR